MLDAVDNFAGLRRALGHVAERDAQWAGVPMPLDDLELTVEPNFPGAAALMEISGARIRGSQGEMPAGVKLRNSFWSKKWRTEIIVWEEDGKIMWGPGTAAHGLDFAIYTLAASVAWGIEQEARALQLLGTLVRHHIFKQYLLTGMFMERSARSGLTYMFRKLRPTVALSQSSGRFRILAALCLHPIGYYHGSWGGAMCPTDDVIAHLMLMRGDEVMFWRRSSQHPPYRHEAGL
jgi:hypothetical protein